MSTQSPPTPAAGFSTPQEAFWAGGFGDDYTDRNEGERWVANNLAFFSRILARTTDVRSVLELGANRGLNLLALKQLLPAAEFTAVEINARAVAVLRRLPWLEVVHDSLLNVQPATGHDFVLIKGVMIHLNPDVLPQVYRLLHDSARRYVCVAEYYNPTPVTVSYRGHAERLFKRDFAGELMRAYPDLKLVDYGFAYRGDPNFPQDDLTWFLLEKTNAV